MHAVLLALFFLVACSSDEGARVVVTIDAQMQVKQRASDIRLVVTDLTNGGERVVHDDVDSPRQRAFPHRLTLRPSDGNATRTYRLEVRAVAGEKTLATARLISGYVADQTRYVRVVLDDACIEKQCGLDQTCSAGACVDARRLVDGFSTRTDSAPISTDVPAQPRTPMQPTGDGPAADGGQDAAPVTPPVAKPSVPLATRTIAAGDWHTCALRDDATAVCWGDNSYGQLGNGSTVRSNVPVIVDGLTQVVALVASNWHTCALRSDRTVRCWGRNDMGQLGDGTLVDASRPVAVQQLANAVEVTTRGWHSCARTEAGSVVCWGSNQNGQLGNGATDASPVPVAVVGLMDATEIAAGGWHTCARKADQTIVCWGHNAYGTLGNGSTTDSAYAGAVLRVANAVELAVGWSHSCARRSDQSVLCWGRNEYGQLGNGTAQDSATSVAATGLSDAVSISAGVYHVCARRRGGGVSCWGNNGAGQLGNGTLIHATAPATSLPSNTDEIAAGNWHTCARQARSISCWGANANGQLGNGSTVDAVAPVQVLLP